MMNYMRVILANQKRRNIVIEKQSHLHHFEKKNLNRKNGKPLRFTTSTPRVSLLRPARCSIAKNNNCVPRRLRDQPKKNENELLEC